MSKFKLSKSPIELKPKDFNLHPDRHPFTIKNVSGFTICFKSKNKRRSVEHNEITVKDKEVVTLPDASYTVWPSDAHGKVSLEYPNPKKYF